MVLPPTYSRRKRLSQTNGNDVYGYDSISLKLRVQVVHIFSDAIGDYKEYTSGANSAECYDHIVRFLHKEFGVFNLNLDFTVNPREEFFTWIQREQHIDRLLDGCEISLRLIDKFIRDEWEIFKSSVKISPDRAIEEWNARFQEASVGYQYVAGEVIRGSIPDICIRK